MGTCREHAETVCSQHNWYPSADQAFNITRETKLATVLNIDNTRRAGKIVDVEQAKLNPREIPGLKNVEVSSFMTSAIYVEANALAVGKVFGLPDLQGVDKYMREKHPELIPA